MARALDIHIYFEISQIKVLFDLIFFNHIANCLMAKVSAELQGHHRIDIFRAGRTGQRARDSVRSPTLITNFFFKTIADLSKRGGQLHKPPI